MSAFLPQKESTLVLGYLSCPLFARFGRLFHTFWFHVGSNWASEAWTRDTWYFLDFKGGSRIQSRLAGGGDNLVWRPNVPSRLYLQDLVSCIQDAEYRLVCRIQDYTYSHSLVAPDKQGPADLISNYNQKIHFVDLVIINKNI